MAEYRLDKSYFKAQSFEEAERANLFDKSIPISERLNMAFDLICSVYGLKEDRDLKIDRTVFSSRKFT